MLNHSKYFVVSKHRCTFASEIRNSSDSNKNDYTTMKKDFINIIFRNDDYCDYEESDYQEYLRENELTETDLSFDDWVYDQMDGWLDSEKVNLDIPTNQIVCIAHLHLWNRTENNYRLCGNNIKSIFDFSTGDYVKFYTDRYNVLCNDMHHDGTNVYTYRELKDNVTKEMFEKAFDNLMSKGQKPTSKWLCRYTKSIRPKVANVYGW